MMRVPLRSIRGSRRPLAGAALAAAVLAGSLMTVPSATAAPGEIGDITLPVLWEGEVRHPGGQPADAEVVAFLRPLPEALVPGVPLVPLARTTTGPSGRFSLRALPTADMAAVTGETGWVTVMLAAFTDDGMSMAVDSVAWKDGRWITDPSVLAGRGAPDADPFGVARTDRGAGAPVGAASLSERPQILFAEPRRPTGEDHRQGHVPRGVGSCTLAAAQDMGDHYVSVGELHLNRDWGGVFEYSQSRYSSFQIGVAHEGSGWSVGGSVSMAKNTSFGVPHDIPAAGHERFMTWKAHMDYKRFDWKCNKGYPNVHHTSTLEPVDWRGGLPMRTEGAVPTCNRRYLAEYGPYAQPKREVGQSITLQAASTVNGFTASMTSAFSESVRNEWHNPLNRARHLCGESGKLTANTRVHALP